jgi:serine phosphatase RsbU (regulator of sigma subunit)
LEQGDTWSQTEFQKDFRILLLENRLTEGTATVGSWVLSFSDLGNAQYVVVTKASIEEMMAPVKQAAWILAAIWFGVSAILFLAMGILLKHLFQPIEFLIKAFIQVGQGSFHLETPKVENEFAKVYDGLRRMQNELGIKDKKIQALVRGLETAWLVSREVESTHLVEPILNEFFDGFSSAILHETFVQGAVYLNLAMEQDGHVGSDDAPNWIFLYINSGKVERVPQSFGTTFCAEFQADHSSRDPQLLPYTAVSFFKNATQGVLVLPIQLEEKMLGFLAVETACTELRPEHVSMLRLIEASWTSVLRRMQLSAANNWQNRIEAELEIARRVQRSTQPTNSFDSPMLFLSLEFQPTDKVGGDWIGIHRFPESSLTLAFQGDVTGHGVDSAFLTSMISGVFRTFVELRAPQINISTNRQEELKLLIERINAAVCDSASRKNMTFFCVLIYENTGCVDYVLGGHPKPLVVVPNKTQSGWATEKLKFATSPMLGTDKNSEYLVGQFVLPPKAILLAYTDGLVENPSLHNSPVSMATLSKWIVTYCELLGQERRIGPDFATQLHSYVREHSNSYDRADDVAMIALQRVA